jgi:hypothetical protein
MMDCKFSRCYCLGVYEMWNVEWSIEILILSVFSLKLFTNMKSWDSNLADKAEVSRNAKLFSFVHLFLRLCMKRLINLSLYGEKDFVGIIWSENKPGVCKCTWTEFCYPPAHLDRTVSLYSPVLGFVGCCEKRNHFLPSFFKISKWYSLTEHFRNLNTARIFVSLYKLFNWLSVLFYWCVWISLQTTVGHWITFILQ